MCVAVKHGVVITSSHVTHLELFSLVDGSLLRTIGTKGLGKCQFDFAHGLCLSPDGDSVLVAEHVNNRVQEVRIADGAWVRFVGENALFWPFSVDCNTSAIAVSERCHRITVFAWCDGTVTAQFGTRGSGPGQLWQPTGLRLLPDGVKLVVADTRNDRLCVFSLTGEFVAAVGSKEQGLHHPFALLECDSDGSFIVANSSGDTVAKMSAVGAVLDVYRPADGEAFDFPCALAALPDGGLVVRVEHSLLVFRSLALRFHWIALCVQAI